MKSMSWLLSAFTAENYRHCCFTGLLKRGMRGSLNQLLCESVNRLNLTHFVGNYTSSTVSVGPTVYGLANKPGPCNGCLITQTYERQQ